MFMMSSGGLTAAELFRGKDAILSGPAGGVVGMARDRRSAGFRELIGFDMGGTSTDVSHFAGEYERAFETEVAGVRMRAPMMLIHTVAAGGGSILHFDGARFRVGPDSAGANPGPKCYRRGGPLAVTDANVMVGKLIPDFFPKIFGPQQDQPLDADAVRAAFATLAKEIGDGRTPEEVADGFIQIAVENMANAIKKISVQRGYDVTRYALNCFGGAGGQHACLVADALGMTTVLIHPLSSLLSAYGMGLADIRATRQQAIEVPLGAQGARGARRRSARTLAKRRARGSRRPGRRRRRASRCIVRAHIRYAGTDTALVVQLPARSPRACKSRLREARTRRGSASSTAPRTGRRGGVGRGGRRRRDVQGADAQDHARRSCPRPTRRTRFFSGGTWHARRVYTREQLAPGHKVKGPALVIEPHQTVVVEHGWQAEVTAKNHLVLRRVAKLARPRAIGTKADPVMLEVFNNLFMSIAEQMGVALQNTAYSVNIKERLDFSCAVFDGDGSLVANAPHMPVHLGSMDRSVETIIRENAGKIRPGDVYAINAPYNGGTHLPDITVCTPVFDGRQRSCSGSPRAAITPTSAASRPARCRRTPPPSRRKASTSTTSSWSSAAASARRSSTRCSPARNIRRAIRCRTSTTSRRRSPPTRRACRSCARWCAHFTLPVVQGLHGPRAGQRRRERAPRHRPAARQRVPLRDGPGHRRSRCGSRVDKEKREATVDFTGTSPQQPTNFNAPEPVTRAAVLYVFRVMVDDDIPMNAGCLRPITIVIPKRSMLSPEYPAAVVAGNVETTQAVTNCLFGALGALAAAQGTMNNLTFGNARYQYYETICSGSPAGPGFDGTDAVHTHMTNTRLTDPEVLELRYPVLLEDFHIRHGSGGSGKWNAGDGISRTIRFLEKMDCAILSGHRRVRPFGLAGGEDGQVGENSVRRNDGRIETLQGCDADRARRRRGDHHPDADRGRLRQAGRRVSATRSWRLAVHRVFDLHRVAFPEEVIVGDQVHAVRQRQHGVAHDVILVARNRLDRRVVARLEIVLLVDSGHRVLGGLRVAIGQDIEALQGAVELRCADCDGDEANDAPSRCG